MRRKAEWFDLPPTPWVLLKMLAGEGSGATVIYRIMWWCQRHRLKPLAYLFYRLNAHMSGCVIGRNAHFGPGFVMLHTCGIVINTQVVGGPGVVLEHGVTIGAEKDRSPRLGANVFVGAGAKILGAVQVGNDVKIGANAVVTKDLPDGATAVGIPACVIKVYGQRVSASGSEPATSLRGHE